MNYYIELVHFLPVLPQHCVDASLRLLDAVVCRKTADLMCMCRVRGVGGFAREKRQLDMDLISVFSGS